MKVPIVIAGLVLGGAVGFFGSFAAAFAGLRLVCLITGNNDYMYLMYFGMLVIPLCGVAGAAVGPFVLARLVYGKPVSKLSDSTVSGFPVSRPPPPLPRTDGPGSQLKR